MLERRVFLSGALGALAVGTTSCSVVVREVASELTEVDSRPNRGAPILVGLVDDVQERIVSGNNFLYVPEGRAWITRYPEEFRDAALAVYPEAMHQGIALGLIGLYQKCPHLGCRVPECSSSQAFECPCHGSQYSIVGEHVSGPSPRGMDLMPLLISNGMVSLDPGNITEGMPHGTDLIGWKPAGHSCLGAATE